MILYRFHSGSRMLKSNMSQLNPISNLTLYSYTRRYSSKTNLSPPRHRKPGIKFHLPVLFVKALITLPTVALLGVELGNGRLTIPFPGQVKFGRSTSDSVARTAAASTASTAPRSRGWRTFNPSGLLVRRCPLQHGSTRLRKEHACLSETCWRNLNPETQHR
jgi:hypothetical protein